MLAQNPSSPCRSRSSCSRAWRCWWSSRRRFVKHGALFALLAVLQLGQRDGSDLVGIDEPLHFPLDPLYLALDSDVFALVASDERRIASAVLVACPEQIGLGQQALEVVPAWLSTSAAETLRPSQLHGAERG